VKWFIFIIVGLFLQLPALSAQPIAEDQVSRLPDISPDTLNSPYDLNKFIESLKGRFSQITSFKYTVQRGTPQDQTYSALTWKEIGEKYCYDLTSVDNGKLKPFTIHDIIAFDGKRTSILKRDGVLSIKDGPKPGLIPLVYPSPLDPYAFLKVEAKFMGLNDLHSSSSLWSNITSRISYAGIQKFMDRDCVVLRFSGSFDQHVKQRAEYDVYFDPKSLIPIGWRAFDSQKCLIEELDAIDFKTIVGSSNPSSFTYTTHYRIIQYQWPGTLTGPSGPIKYYKSSRDIYFNDVQVNSLSPEDIEIDPSLAKAIVDENSHVVIRVPR
jgi:hypothetical protein